MTSLCRGVGCEPALTSERAMCLISVPEQGSGATLGQRFLLSEPLLGSCNGLLSLLHSHVLLPHPGQVIAVEQGMVAQIVILRQEE